MAREGSLSPMQIALTYGTSAGEDNENYSSDEGGTSWPKPQVARKLPPPLPKDYIIKTRASSARPCRVTGCLDRILELRGYCALHATERQELPEKNAKEFKLQKRYLVAQEMAKTEKTFVESLHVLCECVLEPLETNNNIPEIKELVSNPLLAVFFSHAEQINTLNSKLCNILQQRLSNWSDEQTVGDLFVDFGALLKLFSLYAKNHSPALVYLTHYIRDNATVQDVFKQLLGDPACKGQALESFLIAPIQRVPRYVMLLSELIKQTPDPSHPDHACLREALDKVKVSAVHINETIRQREQIDELLAVEAMFRGNSMDLAHPGRCLVREGVLKRMTRSKAKTYFFHLLTDLLLYSVKIPTGGYQLHRRIDLATAGIVGLPNTELEPHAFQITTPSKSFVVCAADELEKEAWYAAIKACIDELKGLPGNTATIIAPVWVANTAADICFICKDKFSLVKRRHHCRCCGLLVCNGCASHKRLLVNIDIKRKARVCDLCNRLNPPTQDELDATAKLSRVQSIKLSDQSRKQTGAPKGTAGSQGSTLPTSKLPEVEELPWVVALQDEDARFAVANQLFIKEREYVEQLVMLMDVFIDPLVGSCKTTKNKMSVMDVPIPADLAVFLNNIEPLYTLNTEIRRKMEDCIRNEASWREHQGARLGVLLSSHASLLSLYSCYAKYHVSATTQLTEPALAALVQELEKDERCNGKKLSHFLMAPVARVNNYVYFITKLLSITPDDHPSRVDIQNGLDILQTERAKINDAVIYGAEKAKLETLEKRFVGHIQPDLLFGNPRGRQIIKEGELTRVTRHGGKQYYFHLFTDLLLYSYKQDTRFELRRRLPLETVSIIPHTSEKYQVAFQVNTPQKSFICCAPDISIRDAWIDALTERCKRTREKRGIEEEEGSSAPVWNNLDGSHCSMCKVQFGVIKRRHHCRCCGVLVCGECSPYKRIIVNIDEEKELRVCKKCSILPDEELSVTAPDDQDLSDVELHHLSELDRMFQGESNLCDREDRQLLKAGPITRMTRHGGKQYFFHLFNDLLLYSYKKRTNALLAAGRIKRQQLHEKLQEKFEKAETPIKKPDTTVKKPETPIKFSLRRRIELEYTMVVDHGNTRKEPFAFQVKTPQKSFVCCCASQEDKEQWMKALTKQSAATKEEKGIDEMFEFSAPVWVNNGAAKTCALCQVLFTMIKRRHHCRNCGALICNECSENKRLLANIDPKRELRVCNTCHLLPDDKMHLAYQNVDMIYLEDSDSEDDEEVDEETKLGGNTKLFNQLKELELRFRGVPAALADVEHPDRRLVKQGAIRRVTRRGAKDYYFHLFDDLLLYSYPQGNKFELRRRMELVSCGVQDADAIPQQQHAFYILTPEKSFACFAPTEVEKQDWMLSIDTCIKTSRRLQGIHETLEFAAPVWVENKAADNCSLCSLEFTLMKRRHHCRRCGALVCQKCSSGKRVLANLSQKKAQRVCTTCEEILAPATTTNESSPL